MKITAAVAAAVGAGFGVRAAEIAPPKAGEVSVKIAGWSSATADISVRDEHLPIPLPGILCHEGSEMATALGDVITNLHGNLNYSVSSCAASPKTMRTPRPLSRTSWICTGEAGSPSARSSPRFRSRRSTMRSRRSSTARQSRSSCSTTDAVRSTTRTRQRNLQ